jgi:hypothetical protein
MTSVPPIAQFVRPQPAVQGQHIQTPRHDTEAGIASPPPPYTPYTRSLHRAEVLWAAFRNSQERTLDIKPLSDHRYKYVQYRLQGGFPVSTKSNRIKEKLLVFAREGQISAKTPVLQIEHEYTLELATTLTINGPLEHWHASSAGPLVARDFVLQSLLSPHMYEANTAKSYHDDYPCAIPHLPAPFQDQLQRTPTRRELKSFGRAHVEVTYYQPYISPSIAPGIFEFFRYELPFNGTNDYTKQGEALAQIGARSFIAAFGMAASSHFTDSDDVVAVGIGKETDLKAYSCRPRPIPQCLDELRKVVEHSAGQTFNCCLVEYYPDKLDSVSDYFRYERFLGTDSPVAALHIGARSNLLVRHKPSTCKDPPPYTPYRMQGDETHKITSCAGPSTGKGYMSFIFKNATTRAEIESFYRRDVATSDVYMLSTELGKMVPGVRPSLSIRQHAARSYRLMESMIATT